MPSVVSSKWIYDNAGFIINDVVRGVCKVPLNDFERIFNCTVIDTGVSKCVLIDGDNMPSEKSILDFVKSYPK